MRGRPNIRVQPTAPQRDQPDVLSAYVDSRDDPAIRRTLEIDRPGAPEHLRRRGSYAAHISKLTAANRRGLRTIDADVALIEGEVLAAETAEGSRERSRVNTAP